MNARSRRVLAHAASTLSGFQSAALCRERVKQQNRVSSGNTFFFFFFFRYPSKKLAAVSFKARTPAGTPRDPRVLSSSRSPALALLSSSLELFLAASRYGPVGRQGVAGRRLALGRCHGDAAIGRAWLVLGPPVSARLGYTCILGVVRPPILAACLVFSSCT